MKRPSSTNGGIWGLTRIQGEPDVAYFAAEGSPEQYVYRIRKADDKRLDIMSFGAADAATVDVIANELQGKGVKFITEPGSLQTPGGGYGFRFFDPDGRTVEVSSDVAERAARELDPRESIPRNLSHIVVSSPNKVAVDQFYQRPARLQDQRLDRPLHQLPALQLRPPLPGDC